MGYGGHPFQHPKNNTQWYMVGDMLGNRKKINNQLAQYKCDVVDSKKEKKNRKEAGAFKKIFF